MQNLKQIYRATYAGETIISELVHEGQEWSTKTEYIPNSVFSTHTTKQAVVIGNGETRLGFDLTHIANHKGGLLATDKLQSYGCNALYRDFTPDFLVTVGKEISKEIAGSGYTADNIVYANADEIVNHPSKFYLIPQNVYYDAGALAAYLACFDGHKKVFLLGFDNYQTNTSVNNVYKNTNGYLADADLQNGTFFELSMQRVMQTYNTVEFIRVMPSASYWIPPSWEKEVNFKQISFRDFVLEADIG